MVFVVGVYVFDPVFVVSHCWEGAKQVFAGGEDPYFGFAGDW